MSAEGRCLSQGGRFRPFGGPRTFAEVRSQPRRMGHQKNKVTSLDPGTEGNRLGLLRSRPDPVGRTPMQGGPSTTTNFQRLGPDFHLSRSDTVK